MTMKETSKRKAARKSERETGSECTIENLDFNSIKLDENWAKNSIKWVYFLLSFHNFHCKMMNKRKVRRRGDVKNKNE